VVHQSPLSYAMFSPSCASIPARLDAVSILTSGLRMPSASVGSPNALLHDGSRAHDFFHMSD
jgi:hypothetical protein